ncbi:hypothetical protein NQ318_004148 [Aromia moschata]|uniref:Uncharacterized protein n=1 Tax=Aromia moschata TaxID=1265417 RepID=A0AAV8YLG9_9CUCU|nr:hypothetical protein NQ318_004148 [Aromia moschata]
MRIYKRKSAREKSSVETFRTAAKEVLENGRYLRTVAEDLSERSCIGTANQSGWMSVGIAVEFCGHMVHYFDYSHKGSALERATDSLANMGISGNHSVV